MKVIILAAGIGQRLAQASGNRPKCLLDFGGMSLLARHFAVLAELPVTEVLIVTGHGQEDILAELERIRPAVPVSTRFNPDYTNGSVVSLWCARQILQEDCDVLLMDADVLYHPQILRRLAQTTAGNCFLLDRDFEQGDEPVKLCVRNGVLIDFRKRISGDLVFDYQGESVGFFRLSSGMAARLADKIRTYIEDRRTGEPYEEVLRDLLLEEPAGFAFEDITGLPWIEIDFPQDIERATQTVLARIGDQGEK